MIELWIIGDTEGYDRMEGEFQNWIKNINFQKRNGHG
jgi:hypothetical protein